MILIVMVMMITSGLGRNHIRIEIVNVTYGLTCIATVTVGIERIVLTNMRRISVCSVPEYWSENL
jgi:hypothetical protein